MQTESRGQISVADHFEDIQKLMSIHWIVNIFVTTTNWANFTDRHLVS